MRGTPINRLERVWTKVETSTADHPAGMKAKAKAWESDVASFLEKYPQVALAAAAVAGLVLGWMIKRK